MNKYILIEQIVFFGLCVIISYILKVSILIVAGVGILRSVTILFFNDLEKNDRGIK